MNNQRSVFIHLSSRSASLARIRRRLVLGTIWLCSLGFPALSSAKKPVQPTTPAAKDVQGTTYLIGAEIHIGNGKVISKGVVEIADDRIVSVATLKNGATFPSTSTVIDVSGKWITPGLIAARTDLGLVEIGMEESTRDNSRTDNTAIRAGHDPSLAINTDSSLVQIQAIEGVTSAAVSPKGGLISGSVAWFDLLAGNREDAVAARSVAVDAVLGRYHGSRAASFAMLRRALDDARFYTRNVKAHERRQTRKLSAHPADLRALLPLLDGTIPLTIEAHRASDILGLIALAKDYELRLVIIGGTEAWKVAEALAVAKIVVVLQPSANLPGSFDKLGARLDNAAILAKRGVTIAIAELEETHNLRNITQEAGIAVAYGLDPETALSAVTLNVATAYGMDKDYGSIEAGKIANLVVWEADPFELDHWAEQVYVRGEAIDMRSRQTDLRDRYRDLSRFRP